jgi:hypothetical protein
MQWLKVLASMIVVGTVKFQVRFDAKWDRFRDSVHYQIIDPSYCLLLAVAREVRTGLIGSIMRQW